MRKSTDFPDWINRPETQQKLKGKTVLMYCTGGVRCERASALLQREYGDSLKGVFQLQVGGCFSRQLVLYSLGGAVVLVSYRGVSCGGVVMCDGTAGSEL